jgi:hypothetical protein
MKLKVFFNNWSYNLLGDLRFCIDKFVSSYLYYNINIIHNDISLLNICENNNFRTDRVINNINKRFIFLANVDDNNFINTLDSLSNDFIIYHGHFLGPSTKYANMLIPSCSAYEYNGVFINIEGRIRKLTKVISQHVITSADYFTILKLCFINYIKTNLSIINNFNRIIKLFDFLIVDWNLSDYYDKGLLSLALNVKLKLDVTLLVVKQFLFNSSIMNYYKTDVYSLNSKNMHLSSLDYLIRLKTFIK